MRARCPELARLEAHLGQPDPDVEAHLAGCPACRRRLETIRQNLDLEAALDALGGDDPPTLPRSHTPWIPTPDIPGYSLEEPPLRGGQGLVFRATRISSNQRVAVKVLVPDAFATSEHRRRFERELDLASSLRHPNVVTVHDGGVTEKGIHYLVMEFVDGHRLRSVPPPEGRDPAPWMHAVLDLFLKVCDGVQYAHQRGVIHRDLKPGNILVDREGHPRIVDFGLAKSSRQDQDLQTTLTGSGFFLGTLTYSAPEQIEGRSGEVDARSDIYSLGVILYELLTGRLPHDSRSGVAEQMRRIIEEDPAPPSSVRGFLGKELDAIIAQAMRRNREQRYPTVEAFAADLRRYRQGEPVQAMRGRRLYVLGKTVRRYRVPLALLTLLFGAVLVFAAGLLVQREELRMRTREVEAMAREQGISNALLLAGQGETYRAEEILWRELFLQHPSVSSVEAALRSPVGERARPHWLLWSIYREAMTERIWELPAGVEVLALSFVDGDESLLIATTHGLEVWSIDEGGKIGSISFPADDLVEEAAVDPTGGNLLVRSQSSSFSLHSLPGLETIARWSIETDSPHSLRLTARGHVVGLSGKSRVLNVWDARSGLPLSSVALPLRVQELECSPDGRFVAVRGQKGRHPWHVQVYSLPGGEHGGDAQIRTGNLVWQDSRTILCTPLAMDIEETGVPGATRDIPGSVVFEPILSRDATRSAWLSKSRRIVGTGGSLPGTLPATLFSVSAPATELALSSAPLRIAAGSRDGVVRLVRVEPGSRRTLLAPGNEAPARFDTLHSVAFSPDGEWFVAGGGPTGEIHVFDARALTLRKTFAGHRAPVAAIRFDPGCDSFFTAAYDGWIRRWSVASLELLEEIDLGEQVNELSLEEDGTLLAAPGGRLVRIRGAGEPRVVAQGGRRIASLRRGPGFIALVTRWNSPALAVVMDGEGDHPETKVLSRDLNYRCLASHPDGSLIAAGSDEGVVEIYTSEGFRRMGRIATGSSPVFSIDVHPSGRLLAVGLRDGGVQLYSFPRGQHLVDLEQSDSQNGIFAVAFEPAGDRLALAGESSTLAVWDLTGLDASLLRLFPYWEKRLSSPDAESGQEKNSFD